MINTGSPRDCQRTPLHNCRASTVRHEIIVFKVSVKLERLLPNRIQRPGYLMSRNDGKEHFVEEPRCLKRWLTTVKQVWVWMAAFVVGLL